MTRSLDQNLANAAADTADYVQARSISTDYTAVKAVVFCYRTGQRIMNRFYSKHYTIKSVTEIRWNCVMV